MQAALDNALPGDEIVLADGNYIGNFIINANSGTKTNPITLRAANLHDAKFTDSSSGCTNGNHAFEVQRDWWIIKGLKIQGYGKTIFVGADHVEIQDNLIYNFTSGGIHFSTASDGKIHDNVVALGNSCDKTTAAIYVRDDSDRNEVINNFIFGYRDGTPHKRGHSFSVRTDSDDNLIQGNIVIAVV